MKALSEEFMSQIVGSKMFNYQQRETGCLNGQNHVETTLTVFWGFQFTGREISLVNSSTRVVIPISFNICQ